MTMMVMILAVKVVVGGGDDDDDDVQTALPTVLQHGKYIVMSSVISRLVFYLSIYILNAFQTQSRRNMM